LFEALGGDFIEERSSITKKVADVLGYSVHTIRELLQIYQLTTRTKFQLNKTEPKISRAAIIAALTLGGEDAVISMAKLPTHTMIDLQHVASEMEPAIQD